MTTNRLFLAVAGAGVLCGLASAQTPLFGGAGTSLGTRPTVPAYGGGSALPPLPPSTVTADAGMSTTPMLPPTAIATDTLTAPQGGMPAIPGAVYSPWCGANPMGVGGNGPVTYEGYVRTGPSLNIGGSELSANLEKAGWMTAVGGRTLFFNPTNDAAWVVDLGISFTNTYGRGPSRITQVNAAQLNGLEGNNFNIPVSVTSIRRTSFNFGVGRDWWLYGPGTVQPAGGIGFANVRGGVDLGGRWGTSSIDLEPQDDPNGVRRRQAVYHGIYVGSSLNWEKQFGGVILQAGMRGEWGYDWMNMLPPQSSDLISLNILMTFGLRY